jgi:hypothetical protein
VVKASGLSATPVNFGLTMAVNNPYAILLLVWMRFEIDGVISNGDTGAYSKCLNLRNGWVSSVVTEAI